MNVISYAVCCRLSLHSKIHPLYSVAPMSDLVPSLYPYMFLNWLLVFIVQVICSMCIADCVQTSLLKQSHRGWKDVHVVSLVLMGAGVFLM